MNENNHGEPAQTRPSIGWIAALFFLPPIGCAIGAVADAPALSIVLGLASPVLGCIAGVLMMRRFTPPGQRKIVVTILCGLAGSATCAGLSFAGCAASFN